MSKLQVVFIASCLLIISGCGTSSGGPGGSVTVSPTSAVVAAGQSTGWTPRYNLTQGLAQTVDWWRHSGPIRGAGAQLCS